VLLCQFLVLAGNRQFFCCGGKVLLRPEKTKDTVICLAGARSFLQPEKKRYSRLSGGCVIIITTRKKRYSRLSGGCAIIITTGKKRYSRLSTDDWNFFFSGRNSGDYDRKKKIPVVCLAGRAVVSVFDYDRKKKSSSHH
jgi:hypothetical protein